MKFIFVNHNYFDVEGYLKIQFKKSKYNKKIKIISAVQKKMSFCLG